MRLKACAKTLALIDSNQNGEDFMKYTFKKPYEFEEVTYTEIEYDLESLTGADISAAKRQYATAGNFSPMPTTDLDFCAFILAKATKQPIEFFNEMPARDYCAITQTVVNFLMA